MTEATDPTRINAVEVLRPGRVFSWVEVTHDAIKALTFPARTPVWIDFRKDAANLAGEAMNFRVDNNVVLCDLVLFRIPKPLDRVACVTNLKLQTYAKKVQKGEITDLMFVTDPTDKGMLGNVERAMVATKTKATDDLKEVMENEVDNNMHEVQVQQEVSSGNDTSNRPTPESTGSE